MVFERFVSEARDEPPDIDVDFDEAFEVGTSEQFEGWLASADEAWFFLDSVDEARLDNPRAFEKAIKRFAKRIRPAMHRAHIVITSRPYAWRFKSDTALVERHLPFKALKQEPKQEVEDASSGNDDKEESPVNIYGLKALDVDGNTFELDGEELLAICIQHELDHLNGILFVDYLSPLKRQRIKAKLEKEARLDQANL